MRASVYNNMSIRGDRELLESLSAASTRNYKNGNIAFDYSVLYPGPGKLVVLVVDHSRDSTDLEHIEWSK